MLVIGPRIGAYERLELLGEGATSQVFCCAHASGEQRALKLARTASHSAALRREYALLRRLQGHGARGIVRVFDAGEHASRSWYALEPLRGGSLLELRRALWRAAPVGVACAGQPQRVLSLIEALAGALHTLHTLGFVHADLTPGNVLLRTPDEPVLIDFGAAARAGSWGREGTAGYVAPERLRDEAWDSRADLYALGCIWYELVTGQPVFASDRDEGLHRQHLSAAPVPPSELVSGFPAELEALLLRLLAKQPEQRIAHAASLLAALGAAPASHTPISFRARLVGRSQQLERVERALREPAVLHVRAEPGAGLTRFLEECTRLARRAGVRALSTLDHAAGADSAARHARTPELHAFACLDAPFAALLETDAALEPALRPLAPYFPVLRAQLRPDGQRPVLERLYAALYTGMAALRASQPLLLCLDHMELADGLSRSFVAWLEERSVALSVLVLVGTTVAPGSVSEPSGLTLPRLSHADTRRMLSDVLGLPEVSTVLADAAYRFSRGLPLAVTEYGAWSGRGDPGATLEDLLSARLAKLDPFVVQTGALAALAGTVFSAADVVQLSEQEPERVGAALETLVGEGFVRTAREDDLARNYFVHEAYRRAFGERLPARRAAVLHRERAQRLREVAPTPLILREIGLHFWAAGRPELALSALRRASRASVLALANDDAIDALERAWDLLAELPTVQIPHATRRVGQELLSLYARAARHDSVFRLGAELTSQLATPLEQSRTERRIAVSRRMLGQYDAAFAALDRAEQHLGGARASSIAVARERIEHAIVRARLLYVRADANEMWRLVRATLPAARKLGRPAQVAALLMDAANALVSRRRYADATAALRYQRRAVQIHQRTALGSAEALFAQFDLAFMLLLADRAAWSEALVLLLGLEAPARALGDAALSCRIVLYTAIAQRKLGAVEACRADSERALVLAQACGLRGYIGAAHACLAWVLLHHKQAGLAEQRLAEARSCWWSVPRDESTRRSEYPFQWLAHAPLLALLVAQERYEECAPWLAELLHPAHARLSSSAERALGAAWAKRADPDEFPLAMESCVEVLRRAGYC